MKATNYITQLTILCFFLATHLQAQELPKKYVAFDIGFGFSQFKTESGLYNLAFTENSVREIEYNIDKAIGSSVGYNYIAMAVKFRKTKGLAHEILFNVPLKGNGLAEFGYLLGYNIPIAVGEQDFIIKPSIGITFGSSSLSYSSISVDTFGIIIENNSYIATDLCISADKQNKTLRSQLELSYIHNQRFGLFFKAGYVYSLSSKDEQLLFIHDDGNFEKTNLGYDNNFISFNRNGEKISNNIYNINNLSFSIGFTTNAFSD